MLQLNEEMWWLVEGVWWLLGDVANRGLVTNVKALWVSVVAHLTHLKAKRRDLTLFYTPRGWISIHRL